MPLSEICAKKIVKKFKFPKEMKITINVSDKMIDAVLTMFLLKNDVDNADIEKYQAALDKVVDAGEITLDEECLRNDIDGLKLEIAVCAIIVAKAMKDMEK